MSLSQMYRLAKSMTSLSVMASILRSISPGLARRPVVTSWRPISSARAVVPSKDSRMEAFSWALARSTSASLTLVHRRIHSRRAK